MKYDSTAKCSGNHHPDEGKSFFGHFEKFRKPDAPELAPCGAAKCGAHRHKLATAL
jgi:hypothetical protein